MPTELHHRRVYNSPEKNIPCVCFRRLLFKYRKTAPTAINRGLPFARASARASTRADAHTHSLSPFFSPRLHRSLSRSLSLSLNLKIVPKPKSNVPRFLLHFVVEYTLHSDAFVTIYEMKKTLNCFP